MSAQEPSTGLDKVKQTKLPALLPEDMKQLVSQMVKD
jgi:hypothetical protein